MTVDAAISTGVATSVLGLATVLLVVMAPGAEAGAVTPVESLQQLQQLCELGPPEVDDREETDLRSYHEDRRRAIQQIYEVELSDLDAGSMRYDRVGGLFTITGFGTMQPFGGGPSLRFRNRTVLRFEFDEHQAHDLMAQLRMGTVEVRLGFGPTARSNYEQSFCDETDDPEEARLDVDLLYARLVDTERRESEGGEVLATYQTRQGHRWMLRRELAVAAGADQSPDVQVTDLQWRSGGKDGESDADARRIENLQALGSRLEEAVEESLFPCYVRGLTANPSLQGAVVLEIPVREGGPGEPKFLMDTIQAEGMRVCIRERIGDLRELSEAAEIEDVAGVKTTVLMRRR